ncbi:hypothetical protein CROQUDRAFT_531899 [Cronartium quercuum f. sp. fusiforme G11]|uniref:Uncharacterized protein n=1 Tax=Cronartium quercuum f. sp. fusiforme G11 TaxID=708437 RepID=A0A9P6TC08_9BASI|nr:hypothetical protein CROQUDRAFT_531899 [Cronartium quercuum f. sp. fusiforme G11]
MIYRSQTHVSVFPQLKKLFFFLLKVSWYRNKVSVISLYPFKNNISVTLYILSFKSLFGFTFAGDLWLSSSDFTTTVLLLRTAKSVITILSFLQDDRDEIPNSTLLF